MKRKYHLILMFLVFVQGLAYGGGRGLSGGAVGVRGYFKKDGTYVAPHNRSAPDGDFDNNWTTKGNTNPYTGEDGTQVQPPTKFGSGSLGLYPPHISNPTREAEFPIAVNPEVLVSEPKQDTGSKIGPKPDVSDNYLIDSLSRKSPSLALPSQSANTTTFPGAQTNIDKSVQLANRATTYLEGQKAKNVERATYWRSKGYSFNPEYMSAYSMDQKVKDIERAKFWMDRGYGFNPEYMSAYSMDQKVKDIERSAYWRSKGYEFSPEYMSAYSMDQKVRDIERARFWKERGLTFDPSYMSAYSMDREAERLQRGSRQ